MIRLLAALLIVVLSVVAAPAQEATINAPESIARMVVANVNLGRDTSSVAVEFRTSGGEPRLQRVYTLTNAAELVSLITAIDTPRSGETGGVLRRFNFRVLGWLVDNGKLVNDSGQPIAVTLVP